MEARFDLTRLDALRRSFETLRAESAGLSRRINELQEQRQQIEARQATLERQERTMGRHAGGEIQASIADGKADLQRDIGKIDRTLADLTARHDVAFERWQSLGRLIERCDAFLAAQRWSNAA